MKPAWMDWATPALLLVIALLLAVHVFYRPAYVPLQYKVETVSAHDSLNTWGNMGWQVVSARWLGDRYEVVMYRPR